MLIDCPNCSRSYQVDQSDIGIAGRAVICPRCQSRWFVQSDEARRAMTRDAYARTSHAGVRPPASAPSRFRQPELGAISHRILYAAAGCLLLAGVLLAARDPIVRLVPPAAALYTAAGLTVQGHGLDFTKKATALRDAQTADVTVSGEIGNRGNRRIAIPRLAFEVRDKAGTSLVRWSEAAPAKVLAAGHKLAFTSTPHHLPDDSRTVFVKFDDDSAEARASAY